MTKKYSPLRIMCMAEMNKYENKSFFLLNAVSAELALHMICSSGKFRGFVVRQILI